MLDVKDEIILEHLFRHARFTTKQLAKVTNLSQSALVYRLQQLEKNNFILKYDAIINWDMLPFVKVIYYAKLQKNQMQRIMKEKPVFAVRETIGAYNYNIWCFFKNKKQKEQFEKNLEKYIALDVKEMEVPELSLFGRELQLNPPRTKQKKLRLDKYDIILMEYLADGHARDSFLKISKDLHLSYDIVNYRIKRLIKSGYFYRLAAQPGDNALGIQMVNLIISLKKETKHFKSDKFILVGKCEDNKVFIQLFTRDLLELKSQIKEIFERHYEEIDSIETVFHSKSLLLNRYPLEWLLEME